MFVKESERSRHECAEVWLPEVSPMTTNFFFEIESFERKEEVVEDRRGGVGESP